MRSAVTAKLLAAVPGLNAIYSSAGEIGEEALLPCALYLQGEVEAGGAWSGLRQIIELWLYVPGLNPVGLDGLSEQTVKALDKQVVDKALSIHFHNTNLTRQKYSARTYPGHKPDSKRTAYHIRQSFQNSPQSQLLPFIKKERISTSESLG